MADMLRPGCYSMAGSDPVVIALNGEWDIYRRDELRELFRAAYDAENAILNLSAVSYADSTILSELVHMRKHRAAQGLAPVALVPSRQFERVLSITRMSHLWPCYANVAEALEYYSSLRLA